MAVNSIVITAIIFFPGMVLHELSHALACFFLGVKVTKAKLWGPSGASISHQPTTGWRNFVVATAPFIANTLSSAGAFVLGHIGLEKAAFLDSRLAPIIIFYWLGVSFAYYAFPSETDRKSGWSSLWRHYLDRMLFRKGFLSALLHWATFPLLLFAKLSLALLGFLDRPKAGLAWAVLLFLATALYFAI